VSEWRSAQFKATKIVRQELKFPAFLQAIIERENEIPYILESNPHLFYSFKGLKNQMRIRIECGLDSRSRAGFWKNDTAGVRAVRTIQLFIILFIILYNISKYL
jgi:hypothetical protein